MANNLSSKNETKNYSTFENAVGHTTEVGSTYDMTASNHAQIEHDQFNDDSQGRPNMEL